MFRPLRGLPVLAVAALALCACGESAGAPSADTPAPSGSQSRPASPSATDSDPSAQPGGTALTVEFLADGENPSATWTLQCNGASPVGSSEAPDPAAACAVLAEQGAALFSPVDADLMCIQQSSGIQRARVTGTVNGEAVDRTFSLRNGCETGKWESLTALLGPAGDIQ